MSEEEISEKERGELVETLKLKHLETKRRASQFKE